MAEHDVKGGDAAIPHQKKPTQFASTDYYRHIKQKYQMKQEQLKK